MISCSHVRQVRVTEGVVVWHGTLDVELREVLPCAYPQCSAGCPGEYMVVPELLSYQSASNIRSFRREIKTTEYQRVTTDRGWRWELREHS